VALPSNMLPASAGRAVPPPSGRRGAPLSDTPPVGCSTRPRLRARRSIVVQVGDARASDRDARALACSLSELGIDVRYLGVLESAASIAESAVDVHADAVEICLAGGRGVALLRQLLRELDRVGLRHVSIVVHRVD